MTVRERTSAEILAIVTRARDEITAEAFRLRRQADTAGDRQRAIRWEDLARDLDEAVLNLRRGAGS
jgi:hypothetical protein